jgi:hypothetical protein
LTLSLRLLRFSFVIDTTASYTLFLHHLFIADFLRTQIRAAATFHHHRRRYFAMTEDSFDRKPSALSNLIFGKRFETVVMTVLAWVGLTSTQGIVD